MTGWSHLEDFDHHFEDIPVHIPVRTTPQPGETTAIACIVGLIGFALMLLTAFAGLLLSAAYHTMLMDRVDTFAFAMYLGPIIWGLAFLATHILHLRQMPDLVQRSLLRATVFTCLAFCVSILFTVLFLTLIGLVHLVPFLADLMVTGYAITAVGLVVWMILCRPSGQRLALAEWRLPVNGKPRPYEGSTRLEHIP